MIETCSFISLVGFFFRLYKIISRFRLTSHKVPRAVRDVLTKAGVERSRTKKKNNSISLLALKGRRLLASFCTWPQGLPFFVDSHVYHRTNYPEKHPGLSRRMVKLGDADLKFRERHVPAIMHATRFLLKRSVWKGMLNLRLRGLPIANIRRQGHTWCRKPSDRTATDLPTVSNMRYSLPIVWPKSTSDKVPPVRTQARSATILPNFVGLKFEVHNGKDYHEVTITEDMVGHKLGEFAP